MTYRMASDSKLQASAPRSPPTHKPPRPMESHHSVRPSTWHPAVPPQRRGPHPFGNGIRSRHACRGTHRTNTDRARIGEDPGARCAGSLDWSVVRTPTERGLTGDDDDSAGDLGVVVFSRTLGNGRQRATEVHSGMESQVGGYKNTPPRPRIASCFCLPSRHSQIPYQINTTTNHLSNQPTPQPPPP
jgi:hypothetical protein